MSMIGFTPTEQRMLAVLSDGMLHTRDELHACLNDEHGPVSNIRPHVHSLKTKLQPKGEDVICQYYRGGYYYRHVRILKSAYRE